MVGDIATAVVVDIAVAVVVVGIVVAVAAVMAVAGDTKTKIVYRKIFSQKGGIVDHVEVIWFRFFLDDK